MGLFDDLDDESPAPMTVIRSYIALAIQLGAPAYNAGDHRGCFDVYACTARFLLRSVKGAPEAPRSILANALKECATEVDPNEQAWMMRRAFDKVLNVAEDN